MATPSTSNYTLEDDPPNGTRSIKLCNFSIQSTKLPILTIPQSDEASNELDLALPEIIFGNNQLSIKHEPTGFELKWNTIDMLREVKKGEGWDEKSASGAVRVAHAEEWKRGQTSTNSTSHMTIVKPFDWTYTTLHPGTTILPNSLSASPPEWVPAPPQHPAIPLALLARTDIPILFFDEIPLFEDELGDNGIADVTIRVRVNSTSFYVLARYSLRIDHVLFRHFDVRLYHSFGSSELVRELKGRQASYESIKSRLHPSIPSSRPTPPSSNRFTPNPNYPTISIPSRGAPTTNFRTPSRTPFAEPSPAATSSQVEDLTKLTDVNWVSQVLEQIAIEEEMGMVRISEGERRRRRIDGTEGGGEGEQGGEGAEWEGKGRKLQVLRVPW